MTTYSSAAYNLVAKLAEHGVEDVLFGLPSMNL